MTDTTTTPAVALPAPTSIDTHYDWDNGPVVTNYENRRVRLMSATVTDFPGTDDVPIVRAEGCVVKMDGSRDGRYGYRVSTVGSGIERLILAAHQDRKAAVQ